MASEAEFAFPTAAGPCTAANSYYYVQSPSSIAHPSSIGERLPTHHSPLNSYESLEVININDDDEEEEGGDHDDKEVEEETKTKKKKKNNDNHRTSVQLPLSRCSSSRASTSCLSFVHDQHKKTSPYHQVLQHNRDARVVTSEATAVDRNRRLSVAAAEDDDDELEEERTMLRHDHLRYLYQRKNLHGNEGEYDRFYYGPPRVAWRKYLSFETYDGPVWTCVQLFWRFLLSLSAALLIFYMVTKPPPPHVSIKVGKVKQFELGEGLDDSGVETKILTCNCSLHLLIDNKSKVFGLHILPPPLDISFGHLTFAASRGAKLNAVSANHATAIELNVAVANKPMYGAGRSMQDMLDSPRGLPLILRLSLKTDFHVVGSLISPKFHHEAKCLLVLHNSYDKNHTTQSYNSTCFVKRSY